MCNVESLMVNAFFLFVQHLGSIVFPIQGVVFYPRIGENGFEGRIDSADEFSCFGFIDPRRRGAYRCTDGVYDESSLAVVEHFYDAAVLRDIALVVAIIDHLYWRCLHRGEHGDDIRDEEEHTVFCYQLSVIRATA